MTLRAIPIDFKSTWRDLGDVCFRVIRCDPLSTELWRKSFSDVYSLCVSRPDPHASRLYEAVATVMKERIAEIFSDLVSMSDSCFLSSYVRHWETYHRGLTDLDTLFKFVNHYYVRSKRPTEADMCYGEVVPTAGKHNMEILQLGLSQWKSFLIDSLQSRLTFCLLAEVSNDRLGVQSSDNYIVPCLDSFIRVDELKTLTKVSLNVYAQIFEGPMMDETRKFYIHWANHILSSMSCTEYVVEALKLFSEENRRVNTYYKDSFPLIGSLFKEVIVQQRLDFINDHIPDYIKRGDKTALRNVFLLLSPTNQCTELIKLFGLNVAERVTRTISALSVERSVAAVDFVNSLIADREEFVAFIDEVFDGTMAFRSEMDKAFSQAINNTTPSSSFSSSLRTSKAGSTRAAEFLSGYIDGLLRCSTTKLTEAEIDEKISASICLFKYIEEKDVFRQYYQHNLSARLLFGSSTLLHLEESTITQLKNVCGHEFTSKFQRMFNDIQLARSLNSNFQEYIVNKGIHFNFAHHVDVLTVSGWPISSKPTLQFCLPRELQSYNTTFESFYTSSFEGRNIRWALNYCTAELRMIGADRPYCLTLSALNAAVLMLFDSMNGVDLDAMPVASVEDSLFIQERTVEPGENIDHGELIKRAILPLVETGLIFLTTSDGAPTDLLSSESMVTLNSRFTNKRLKVKVPFYTSSAKEDGQDYVEQVTQEVEEDRRNFTQAAIARIMKTRKTCRHNVLVKDVIDSAKGRLPPTIPVIKQCIEGLIERGYIERSPNDTDQYNYLA